MSSLKCHVERSGWASQNHHFFRSGDITKYYVIEQKGKRIAARISCPFSLLFKQLSKLAGNAYCCGCFFFLAAARAAKKTGSKAIGTATKAIATATELEERVRGVETFCARAGAAARSRLLSTSAFMPANIGNG
jgi:hypothetical protein